MSLASSAKRRLAPAAKVIAPHWFWRRKFGILAELGESNAEMALVRSLCDPQKVSIDIGADVGEFAIAMLSRSASVVAFEPRPAQARELAAMFTAAKAPVLIEAVALSDTPGTTQMRVLEADPGRSTIDTANPMADEDDSAVVTIDVPVKRLDDYGFSGVGFVKVDVEGHELAVLRGATETLRANRPTLVVEAEERHHHNAVAEISEFLAGLDYSGYFELAGERRPIGDFDAATHQDPANISSWKDGWTARGVYVNNFVFVPR